MPGNRLLLMANLPGECTPAAEVYYRADCGEEFIYIRWYGKGCSQAPGSFEKGKS